MTMMVMVVTMMASHDGVPPSESARPLQEPLQCPGEPLCRLRESPRASLCIFGDLRGLMRESVRPFRGVAMAAEMSFDRVSAGLSCPCSALARSDEGVSEAFPRRCHARYALFLGSP